MHSSLLSKSKIGYEGYEEYAQQKIYPYQQSLR